MKLSLLVVLFLYFTRTWQERLSETEIRKKEELEKLRVSSSTFNLLAIDQSDCEFQLNFS